MGIPTGSTVGKSLSNLFADISIKSRTVTVQAEQANAAKARSAQMEEWERELAPYFKEVIGWALDDPEITPEQRAILAPLTKPENQTDFFLSILAILGIVLTGLPAAASGIANGLMQRSMKKFAQNPVPIDGLIQGVVNDRFDFSYAVDQAAWQGYHPGELGKMVDAARPSLGAAEILEAARRKVLTGYGLDEWLNKVGFNGPSAAVLNRLVERLPDLGIVISAVTQSQLSDGQAQAFMEKHGIDPGNFEWIKQTAGQSPGIDLVLELLNKELISEGEARTAVLESPIKNKYLEAMMKARFRIPPMEQTVSMLRRGAYTPAEATHNLNRLGFFPEDIAKLVDWATQEKIAAPRDLTAGQIVDNYEIGLIDRSTATNLLVGLRYDTDEATMYLDLADAKKARQKLDRAVSKVHSRFVAWKITDVEASSALDALQVPVALRDELFDVWTVEREINRRDLTPAQMTNAYFAGLLAKSEVYDRLRGLGYDERDATIFMDLQGISADSPENVQ